MGSVISTRLVILIKSTRLVMLIKNIYTLWETSETSPSLQSETLKYTLWGRKRFLLPVTYFSTTTALQTSERNLPVTHISTNLVYHLYGVGNVSFTESETSPSLRCF